MYNYNKNKAKVMMGKLRVKSGEALVIYWYQVEDASKKKITKRKTRHKMIKVKIKIRRNSKVRRVEIDESKTRSRVDEKKYEIKGK